MGTGYVYHYLSLSLCKATRVSCLAFCRPRILALLHSASFRQLHPSAIAHFMGVVARFGTSPEDHRFLLLTGTSRSRPDVAVNQRCASTMCREFSTRGRVVLRSPPSSRFLIRNGESLVSFVVSMHSFRSSSKARQSLLLHLRLISSTAHRLRRIRSQNLITLQVVRLISKERNSVNISRCGGRGMTLVCDKAQYWPTSIILVS